MDKRSFTAWTPGLKGNQSAFAVDFDLPADAYKQVSFYFVDWDPNGKGSRDVKVEANDPATGKLLAQTQVRGYGPGCYANFLLAGKVRMVVRAQNDVGASVSGFFI